MKKIIFTFAFMILLFSVSFSSVLAMGHSNSRMNHPNIPMQSIGKISPNAAHGMHTAWQRIQNSNGMARHVFEKRFRPVGHPDVVLESVEYVGTCSLFGDYIDDKIIFTFSDEIVHNTDVKITFETEQELWESWGADKWTVSDNIATLEINRIYSSPRDLIGDYVIDIMGLEDTLGNQINIPDAGVEISGDYNYDLVGDWKLDLYVGETLNERFIIIDTHEDDEIGGFFGVGYDSNGTETGEITGTIDGDSISMTYDREGYGSSYTADFEGTIDSCDFASGTWSDSNNTDETWEMHKQ